MLHDQWSYHLNNLLKYGRPVGPRGKQTVEHLDVNVVATDSRLCLLDVRERKLNVRFAVAEWLWVIFGHSDVGTIARYNPKMMDYSDDGLFLTGAYGPHVHGQWHRVLTKLKDDPSTRQAVIEIPRPWRETKDEPCTLSLQFLHREGLLHLIATMRSSDIWLGLPYDCFTFMQLQNVMAAQVGARRGWFSIHLGSSHLYETDREKAQHIIDTHEFRGNETISTADVPGFPPNWLDDVLVSGSSLCIPANREDPAVRPWLRYAYALLAPSNTNARWELGVRPEVDLGTGPRGDVMRAPTSPRGA